MENPPLRLGLMGVAGAGKTTLGEALALRLAMPYLDSDAFHPPANRAKMAAGVPLSDADRWPWLDAIAAAVTAQGPCIFSCSALKAGYRARLDAAAGPIRWIWLDLAPDLAAARIARRANHFFPASLVASQFSALEAPEAALRLDAAAPLPALVEQAAAFALA